MLIIVNVIIHLIRSEILNCPYTVLHKPGGLNLSWSGLDWESRSRHLEKVSLNSRDFLDTLKKDSLKNDISTNLDKVYAIKSLFVLTWSRSRVETVKTFLTLWKRTSRLSRNSQQFEKWHLNKSRQSLCYKVLICLNFYLCLDWDSWSQHFEKGHLDCWESLNTLKKDISTDQEISISILIGLNSLDLQA